LTTQQIVSEATPLLRAMMTAAAWGVTPALTE
jgi:hypothetical protein